MIKMNLGKKKKSKKQPKLTKAEKLRINRLKRNASMAKKSSSQNTLRYTSLFENGLMHVVDNTYSRSFELGSANYVTALKDEQVNIISSYNDMINTLSAGSHFQLTLLVSKVTNAEYKAKNEFTAQGDQYATIRDELNEIIDTNYAKGFNNYNVEKYITVSTKADNDLKADSQLENMHTVMENSLMNISVPLKQISGIDRLKVMNKIMNYNKPLYGNYDDIRKSSLSTKDLIAPDSIRFKKTAIEVGDTYNSVIYLKDFPMELSDAFFKELTESGQELVITIHAQPYSVAETNKRLRAQATNIESELIKQQSKASKEGYSTDFVGRTTKEAQLDLDEVIEFIRETGDKQFSSIFLIYLKGDTEEELEENISVINSIGEKYGAVFSRLPYMQEEGFNSVLPIGKNFTDVEKTFQRDLITPNISINSPFTNVDIEHENGKYYGTNLLSKNVISIDRRDPSLDNSNGIITGVSGSGKSMTAKYEIITTLLQRPNDEVIVLSPENEYDRIAERLGGQLVKVAPKSTSHINVLDLPDDSLLYDDDDSVGLKSSFLVSLFSSLFSSLTEIQESIIDEVTIKTYQEYEKPTLNEWYEELNKIKNAEAMDLSYKLKLYITGSLDMFSHETDVDLNSRFVVYNINQLKNKFKPFGFMAVEEKIWQRVVENKAKGVTTWVYFDEIQVLLTGSASELSRERFQDLWARIRKYGGNPTGITQSIETVLATDEGRSMFFNSEFLVLLKQKASAYEMICKLENLTEQQSRFLKNPNKGGGLIVAGSSIVPFENHIPSDTELFKIMETD